MSVSKILKCCTAVVLSAFFSTAVITASAYDYYDDNQDYSFYEDSGVEYIPPENDGYQYFDDYHQDADDYYDENDYMYDEYSPEEEYTSETTEQEESSEEESSDESELMEQISVDTKELTSKDWENIQKTLNSNNSGSKKKSSAGAGTSNNSQDEFGTIKEKSEYNDVGQYLVYGILLLLAGITILVTVIVINVKANRRAAMRKKARPVDPLSMSLRDVQQRNKRDAAKRKKRIIGGRRSTHRRSYYSESIQGDLVDILDDPKLLEYTGEI